MIFMSDKGLVTLIDIASDDPIAKTNQDEPVTTTSFFGTTNPRARPPPTMTALEPSGCNPTWSFSPLHPSPFHRAKIKSRP